MMELSSSILKDAPQTVHTGEALEREMERLGRGTMTYHDADHYGITIPVENVEDVKVVGR